MNNVLVPHEGYRVERDLGYGNDPAQQLDIYIPDGLKKPAKVIVFFHGGSWQSGSREEYRFVGQAFASKGYVTVVADYRLYPHAYFPDFMEDAARAFVWVHAHIKDHGGDQSQLFVFGHSAGAHMALLLTLDTHYVKDAGGSPAWIKGAIGLSGPYDFLPLTDPEVIAVFSKRPEIEGQPIHFVRSGLPPIFLATGDEDTDVKPKNTHNLAAKLREYRNRVTERTYKGVAHIGIILALADGFRDKAPVLNDIDQFLRASSR